ncbi:MAG: PAS domain-containing sensor histidine kinase [Deltaproteobacteria bacterium]|nr:MAG: PAS domain-containing sensor histidine kinase [Deltaproteobacteria bacterium]
MSDAHRTRAQLEQECQGLRERVDELEARQHALTGDVLDSAAVGLCILDKKCRIAWINRPLERFFALNRDDLIGKHARQVTRDHMRFLFEDPEAFSEGVLASYENDAGSETFECHVLPSEEREERWLEYRSEPIRSGYYAGGRIEHYFDITNRKQAEAALQLSEARYQALANKAYDIIAEFDADGRFVYLSPSFEKIMGFSTSELIGRPVTEIIRDEDKVDVEKRIGRLLVSGAIGTRLTQVRHRDGGWRWIEGTGVRFETPDGEIRLMAIGRDMTERKHMEEQLVRSERLASIGTLAAGIAHEINNPLGGTLLAAQFALEFQDDSDAVTNALKVIVRQTKRCAEVVSGVLTFAREGRSEKRPADLNAVVRHARDLIRSYAKERGATLELLLAEGLPELDMNEAEIGLVIVNLIRNAVQASAEHIRLLTRSSTDFVELTIHDDGSGISEDEKRRLFEPFYTTRENEGGTGLGLSIAHGIVTGHEGTIDVESELEKGTLVTIRLPLAGDDRG